MHKIALAVSLAALAVAGCASITPRGSPPDLKFETAKPIEVTMPCIIRGMDALWDGYTHTAQTISLNQEYEIRPNRDMVLGGDPLFVNIKRTPANGTAVAVYSVKGLESDVLPAVNRCR